MHKNILLVVTGLTPQVVTETLYVLSQSEHSLPAEVHVLTTSQGAQRAQLTLFTDGWFDKFCKDYNLEGIGFNQESIHTITNHGNEPLADIRTPQQNLEAADAITEWVRKLTEEPDSRLHVSIAGGRKTMGFYAGYALSLFGREQDRLSHVLVSAPYETHPNFFYPTPYSRIIYTRDNQPLDTKNAEIALARIQFVRLRHVLDKDLLPGISSYSELVASAQISIDPPQLIIDLRSRYLIVKDKTIKLQPVQMAFYHWIVQKGTLNKTKIHCPPDGAPNLQYAEEFNKFYKEVVDELGMKGGTQGALIKGMDNNYFSRLKTRVNSVINKALGVNAMPYLIGRNPTKPKSYFAVGLKPEQIQYK